MIHIEKNTVEIGLAKPLKILHITDSHIPFYCEADTEAIINQAKNRNREESVSNLAQLMQYAEENCDLVVHSGDLIDFISIPCVEFAREYLQNEKVLFVAGNHEYWRCDGGIEDMAYRMESIAQSGGPLCEGLLYNAHIIGGVNFVGIDESYHQAEYEQLDFLKEEVKKGYPVVLFMHAPLYEEELYKQSYAFWNNENYVLGCDPAVHPEIIGDQTEPTESTKAFYDYVIGEKQIKAVLTGHLHFAFESRLPGGTIQFVTNRADRGNAREITFL